MHTIRLDVKSYTDHGGAHSNLYIDGHVACVLYLSKSELDTLVSALRVGCLQSNDIVFEQTEPESEQFEYDVFDD